jgi:hypothetical protein
MDSRSTPSARCEACRYWEGATGECHRHAPALLPAAGPGAGNGAEAAPARVWPRTRPDEWCGEWAGTEARPAAAGPPVSMAASIAARAFLSRVAPGVELPDPEAVLEALLNQLPPDVRRVIVRLNGLDGQPLVGLRDVARDLRMSREQVRVLQAAGDKRLSEVVAYLVASLGRGRGEA